MVILGVDPGLATLGYGLIEKDVRGNFYPLTCGVITTPKEEGLPVRLALLEEGLKEILDTYHPDEVAMEELFFSKNITTGIAVAHARGVALLTCVKACGRLYEYTPMQIKQALTGYGKADKKQIQTVVTSLLHLKAVPKPDDAADALAIALCHGFSGRFGEMYAVGNMTRAKGQNAPPASEYQALMQAADRQSKKKSGKGFSSGEAMASLQEATGISGVTGVGRAGVSKAKKSTKQTQTTGAGVRSTPTSTVEGIANGLFQRGDKA